MRIVHFTYCVFLLCVLIENLTYLVSVVLYTIYHYSTQNPPSKKNDHDNIICLTAMAKCLKSSQYLTFCFFTNVEIVLQGLT